MDFKFLYEQWTNKNGGLRSSIRESNTLFNSRGEDAIVTHSFNGAHLLPGNFFVFNYEEFKKMTLMQSGKSAAPFYDSRPFVLSLGFEKNEEICLNLNVLPIQIRMMLFNTMYKAFESKIMENVNVEPISWKIIPFNEDNIKNIVRIKSNIAINRYKRPFIRNIRAIDWGSMVKASTLYMPKSIVFNQKKNITLEKIFRVLI